MISWFRLVRAIAGRDFVEHHYEGLSRLWSAGVGPWEAVEQIGS